VTTNFVLELVDVVADAVVEVLGKEETVEAAVQAEVVVAIAKKKFFEVVVLDEEENDEMAVVDLSIDCAGCTTIAETRFGSSPSQPPRY
jgi:hypothetical protein